MKALQRLSLPAARSLQKLTQKKYRRESGSFLVEGPHLVAEAIASGAPLRMVVATEEAAAKPEAGDLLAKAGSMKIPVYGVSSKEMERLSDAVTSQGILGVIAAERPDLDDFWTTRRTSSLIVALEHVSDPGNVGTIVRTCAWFGVDALLLSVGCVELQNPKVIRSTMGALFHLPVFEELDLGASLLEAKKRGYRVAVTAVAGGSPFDRARMPEKTVLVFGSESSGVSAPVAASADLVVTIPRFGRGESLNVGAACAAMLGSMRLP
jgi:TrmH family RNA methyltransferase